MSNKEQPQDASLVWRSRARRLTVGTNAIFSILLFGVLALMLNFAAFRYLDLRHNFSSLKFFALSEKTESILGEITGSLKITSVFSEDEILGGEVGFLLKEYVYSARAHQALTLELEFVDPDRDLLRVKEIKDAYGLEKPNFLVVEYDGRSRIVGSDNLVDVDSIIDYSGLMGGNSVKVRKQRVGFRGEQAISSAIYSLSREKQPAVYFLQGHGEREIEALKTRTGFGTIAREMQRDNISVRTFQLNHTTDIPDDCDAIVIAGPRTDLSVDEIDLLRKYLDQNGRLLLLVDPGSDGALNPLLNEWGVTFDNDFVLARERTKTGREIMIIDYGPHPITKPLNGIFSVFYLPRSVNPLISDGENTGLAADRPKVTILAGTGHDGWAERNFETLPARFDEGEDRAGPIPVAVAVERGGQSRIDLELQPTRLVVIGDTDFASNIALQSAGGGNADLFMNSINWLLQRDTLMAIAPKRLLNVRLQMDQKQIKVAYLVIAVLIPLLVAFVGLLIWVRRGR
ncbi:MAG: hypothetical protein ACI9X0_001947 [Kiritimatiellia bacterium]